MNQGRLLVDDRPDAALDHPEVAAAYLGGSRHAAVGSPQPGTMNLAPAGAAPRSGLPVVELADVDVFYGSVQALFGVSIKVEEGEVVAVLGGNASGKSTTVKTVLRLVRATRGEVRVFGRALTRESTADVIAAGVASIPEGRRMFVELSVRDNLLMGAFARRGAHDLRLDDELELVLAEFPWLSSRLDQLAGTLSGGEQQMVAMARAWLRRPRLLCIDEPSMGLSPKMVDRIYDILFRWKAQGLTILMVEQSANRALELADRAYVLRNGVVALEGEAAALRADSAVQRAYLGDQSVSDRAA
jgi:branched-chain amino acid transport system ATP-binding protein